MPRAGRPPGPVWLLGPPGAGKTTIGRLLAKELGWPFRDLDEEIASAAGRSIAEIFAREGEALFRMRERQALNAAAVGGRAVVACGAGIVESAANRSLLARAGTAIWLDLPASEALARCRAQPGLRPLLDDEQALRERLARRMPHYRALGRRVDARGEPRAVAALVRQALKSGPA